METFSRSHVVEVEPVLMVPAGLDAAMQRALWRAIHALEDRAFGHDQTAQLYSDLRQTSSAVGLRAQSAQDHEAADCLRGLSDHQLGS